VSDTLRLKNMTQQLQRLVVLHRQQAKELAVAMPCGRVFGMVEVELTESVSRLGSLLAGIEVPACDDIELVAGVVLRF